MFLKNSFDWTGISKSLAKTLPGDDWVSFLNSSSILRRSYLIVYNELGVLVEDGVLALGEGCELPQHPLGVDIWGCRVHQAIGLPQNLTHVHCITMVEEKLQDNNAK